MDRLGRAAAIAGIVAAIAAVATLALDLWPRLDKRSGNSPASNAPPSAGAQSLFADFKNPLSGTGCDTQCLPIFYRAEPGKAMIEIYNQAFGISEVAGVVQGADGEHERFGVDYIPGRHGRYHLKLRRPSIVMGSKFEVCMRGKIEGEDTPLTWRTSYEVNPELGAVNIRRVAPVVMKIGPQARAC